MSQSEIERLIGDLSTNDALRDRLGSVGDDFDAALSAVRDAGYGIEADEARAYLAALSAGTRRELEDKDLDAVTGGEAAPDAGWGYPAPPPPSHYNLRTGELLYNPSSKKKP